MFHNFRKLNFYYVTNPQVSAYITHHKTNESAYITHHKTNESAYKMYFKQVRPSIIILYM